MSKFHLEQLLHPALRWPTPVMAQDFDTGLEAAQQGISKQFFRTGFHSLSRQTSARISISHSCARVAWSYRMTIPKRSAGIVKRQNRFMPALRTISDTYIYIGLRTDVMRPPSRRAHIVQYRECQGKCGRWHKFKLQHPTNETVHRKWTHRPMPTFVWHRIIKI
jgi:hypothetical protein